MARHALSITLKSLALASTLTGAQAFAQECSTWLPMGQGGGSTVAAIYDFAHFNGELFAGGEFFDGQNGHCLARWDGSSWELLPVTGTVRSFVMYNGDLIIGGFFSFVDGQLINNIARWDGSSWHPLGQGVTSMVQAMTVYNGDLIVGGSFTTAGGQVVNNIARWDGSAWHPLGSGTGTTMPAWYNGMVHSLQVYDGELIVGGSFNTAGGVPVESIARWNGASWQPLGAGVTQGIDHISGTVRAMTVYNGELYVGGDFTTAGGQVVNNIARWDGSWHPVGQGTNAPVRALGMYNGQLFLGGEFTQVSSLPANFMARWNGALLAPVTGGLDGTILALSPYENDLLVGGAFNVGSGHTLNGIARWNFAGVNFLQHPQHAIVAAGETAVLSISLEQPESFFYQWRKDGAPLIDNEKIGGATTTVLTINDATTEDVGVYDVLLYSTCGFSTLSMPAALGVAGGSSTCAGDVAPAGGDGMVNVNDLLQVISSWGMCPR